MRFLLATCDADPAAFLLLSRRPGLDDGSGAPCPCWNGCAEPVTHPLVEVRPPELRSWIGRQIRPEIDSDGPGAGDPPDDGEPASDALSAVSGPSASGSSNPHRSIGGGAS